MVVADLTKPSSLEQDMFTDVRSIICCTAVRVSPKEGDTANRDKYKQACSCISAVLCVQNDLSECSDTVASDCRNV